jgi:hypothetical protein
MNMAKVKIGKPPAGLTGEQLLAWVDDQYEDAYEKQLFDHREARRKAEAAVETAQAEMEELRKQLPDEGAVLLKGEDAEKWAELQKVDLNDLRTKALAGERIARQAFLHEVAEAAGFNPKTFTELVELRKVKVEAREVDGKTTYVVATEKDGKAEEVDVAAHFQTAFADWLPALTPPTSGATRPPLGTLPTGRLPSAPPRGKPGDVQQAMVARAQAEAQRSKSVLARALVPEQGGNS